MDTLWENKIEIFKDDKEKEKFRKLKFLILEAYEQYPGKRLNIKDFLIYIELCITKSILILDLDKLKEEFNLSSKQEEIITLILKDELFYNYLAIMLITIILNEISFASKNNPEINLSILEYIISNFGINFISAIPAIADERLSFGPFQLTDIVVGKNSSDKKYPITTINECIRESFSEYKLSEDLAKFKNKDHYQGEVFLCIYYLCRYIKEIDETQLDYLISLIKNNDTRREEFYKKLISVFSIGHHGGEGELIDFIKGRELKENVKIYLDRTESNYQAVIEFLKNNG
ncbi:MAG: hypothetical protein KatS3mg095_0848 [Candidatus Parcubacteria bacterium]|nr:MAG: hypothetical protein KatS3mg095_0848 [Candidatus Parcubacteria bacterium]